VLGGGGCENPRLTPKFEKFETPPVENALCSSVLFMFKEGLMGKTRLNKNQKIEQEIKEDTF
jgi:hypothetical protein